MNEKNPKDFQTVYSNDINSKYLIKLQVLPENKIKLHFEDHSEQFKMTEQKFEGIFSQSDIGEGNKYFNLCSSLDEILEIFVNSIKSNKLIIEKKDDFLLTQWKFFKRRKEDDVILKIRRLQVDYEMVIKKLINYNNDLKDENLVIKNKLLVIENELRSLRTDNDNLKKLVEASAKREEENKEELKKLKDFFTESLTEVNNFRSIILNAMPNATTTNVNNENLEENNISLSTGKEQNTSNNIITLNTNNNELVSNVLLSPSPRGKNKNQIVLQPNSNNIFNLDIKMSNVSPDDIGFTNDIIKDPSDASLILEWLGNQNVEMQLIFKGSKDGDQAEKMHQLIDKIKPTLFLIRTKSDKIFGGFTSECWDKSEKFEGDKKAFLFSLTNKKCYKNSQGVKGGIYHSLLEPINFGSSNYCDLRIYSGFYEKRGFENQTKKIYLMEGLELTGEKYFYIDEIEMYKVIFNKN